MKQFLAGIRNHFINLNGSINVQIYVFGSCLRNDRFANDIDLLVIYKTMDELISIKNILLPLQDEYPLDLLFASTEEAEELQLVQIMNAQLLV